VTAMRYSWLATLALLAVASPGLAQNEAIGPGGIRMAPGASQPRDFTPGGIGPGGRVAPGPAARGVNVDRIGPGGTRLAPGSARSVGAGTAARAPLPTIAPSSRQVSTSVHTKRRAIHRIKRKRHNPDIM